jgi:uncharacterized protein involved in exopolysaccharide biosynthesis
LLLDYRTQVTLFELLILQREAARIEEAKYASFMQVLEAPFVPNIKSGPKRSLIVLLATFTVGFFAVLAAFVREYRGRSRGQDRRG